MKTITFYSYKGGVGRTLLLGNVAKYLSKFGQKVFALDFDLEAPGLHYKLTPAATSKLRANNAGLVAYIHALAFEGNRKTRLQEHVVEVERGDNRRGAIHLMPAGSVLTSQYWQQLARINWHEFFYSEGSRGVSFFLELKAQIEKEFSPDFLLIDSRTGVTEMSGVATTLLPDTIVCLLLNNRENLDGAREVLRSILRTRRQRGQPALDILPVLARIPPSDEGVEAETLETVSTFLHEEAAQIEDTLSTAPLLVLHSEPRLQLKESLLIESSASSDSMLLRDYIRLIAQVVPADVLTPHVVPLVREAMNSAWDDAQKAEKDLVALCEVSSVPEAHQALIKFYSLSRAGGPKILDAAQRYWQMTGREDDPLLLKVLRANFEVDPGDGADVDVLPEFVEAVWREDGAKDVDVGFQLARLYRKHERYDMVAEAIRSVAKSQNLEPDMVAECLQMLRRANESVLALDLY